MVDILYNPSSKSVESTGRLWQNVHLCFVRTIFKMQVWFAFTTRSDCIPSVAALVMCRLLNVFMATASYLSKTF